MNRSPYKLLLITLSLAALLLGGCVGSLQSAAAYGDLAKVKALVENGTDINNRDSYGGMALISAAANGQTEVVKYLLDKGADINAPDASGCPPLMCAIVCKKLQTAKLLLERGADLDLCDNEGDSARTLISKYGMENLLLNATASRASAPPPPRRASKPTQSPEEAKLKPPVEPTQPLL